AADKSRLAYRVLAAGRARPGRPAAKVEVAQMRLFPGISARIDAKIRVPDAARKRILHYAVVDHDQRTGFAVDLPCGRKVCIAPHDRIMHGHAATCNEHRASDVAPVRAEGRVVDVHGRSIEQDGTATVARRVDVVVMESYIVEIR